MKLILDDQPKHFTQLFLKPEKEERSGCLVLGRFYTRRYLIDYF